MLMNKLLGIKEDSFPLPFWWNLISSNDFSYISLLIIIEISRLFWYQAELYVKVYELKKGIIQYAQNRHSFIVHTIILRVDLLCMQITKMENFTKRSDFMWTSFVVVVARSILFLYKRNNSLKKLLMWHEHNYLRLFSRELYITYYTVYVYNLVCVCVFVKTSKHQHISKV